MVTVTSSPKFAVTDFGPSIERVSVEFEPDKSPAQFAN